MKTFGEWICEAPEFDGVESRVAGNPGVLTYVDLDGVLADFVGAAENVLGREIDTQGKDLNNDDWRQIHAAEDFWATLPFLRSGRKLWGHIRKQRPFILSALPRTARQWAQDGKLFWVGKNLPSVTKDRILLVNRKDKQKFAMNAGRRPNLLIDDNAKNIREWEAAGGIGILHRSEAAEKTIARLKKLGY